MRRILLLAFLLVLPTSSHAQQIFKTYLGANAVSYDAQSLPADFEAGLTARASLSPHISLVGSGFYGITEKYLTGAGGLRVTATDVENTEFSIGVGAEYQVSDDQEVRPNEWVGKTSIGWRPWPVNFPRLVVGVQGLYGLRSHAASALVALRFEALAF